MSDDSGRDDLNQAQTPDSRTELVEDEPMGGDPPCWAHLFGEDPGPTADELDTVTRPDSPDRPDAS